MSKVYCFVYPPLATKKLGKRATQFSKPFSSDFKAENTMKGFCDNIGYCTPEHFVALQLKCIPVLQKTN